MSLRDPSKPRVFGAFAKEMRRHKATAVANTKGQCFYCHGPVTALNTRLVLRSPGVSTIKGMPKFAVPCCQLCLVARERVQDKLNQACRNYRPSGYFRPS